MFLKHVTGVRGCAGQPKAVMQIVPQRGDREAICACHSANTRLASAEMEPESPQGSSSSYIDDPKSQNCLPRIPMLLHIAAPCKMPGWKSCRWSEPGSPCWSIQRTLSRAPLAVLRCLGSFWLFGSSLGASQPCKAQTATVATCQDLVDILVQAEASLHMVSSWHRHDMLCIVMLWSSVIGGISVAGL